MRKKELRLVITFAATPHAMKMEAVAKAAGAPGRIIPVPTQITAGCGLAYMAPPQAREELEQLMQQQELVPEQIVEMMM